MLLSLCALLIGLQFGDWYTSWRASKLPFAYEANPIMRAAMKALGFDGAFIAKILVVTLLAFVLTLFGLPGKIMLALLDAVYAAVCYHNWKLTK